VTKSQPHVQAKNSFKKESGMKKRRRILNEEFQTIGIELEHKKRIDCSTIGKVPFIDTMKNCI